MQDYWKKFYGLIEQLKLDHKTDLVVEFKEAQRYVNGLTDGWYDFKSAFEDSLKLNRSNMTAEQCQVADLLLKELNEFLTNK